MIGRLLGKCSEYIAHTHSLLEHYQINPIADFIDPLTKLKNQQYFRIIAERELVAARENGTPLCLVGFNIVGFRNINDYFGHVEGGRLLSYLGEQLKGILRQQDILARWEADHFVLLIRNADHIAELEDTKPIANRLRQALQEPPFSFPIEISLQVVHIPAGEDELSLMTCMEQLWQSTDEHKLKYSIFR